MSSQFFKPKVSWTLVMIALSAPAVDAAVCPANQLGAGSTLLQDLLRCAQELTRRPENDPGETAFAACLSAAKTGFASRYDTATTSTSDCQLTLGSSSVNRLFGSLSGTVSDPTLAAWRQTPPVTDTNDRFSAVARNRRFSTLLRVVGDGFRRRLAAESGFIQTNEDDNGVKNTRRARLSRALNRRLRHLTTGRADYNGPTGRQLGGLVTGVSEELVRLVLTRAGLTLTVPEAADGLSATEAADGTPVLLGLPAPFAQAGDLISVTWGNQTPVRATLDAAAISAGVGTINVPVATIAAAGSGTINITGSLADAGATLLAVTNPAVQVTAALRTNRPPVAVNDSTTGNEDSRLSVDPLSNDSDPDGDTLTISSFTQGANGRVQPEGEIPNRLVYLPNADFNGSDAFTYTISDGNGGTATATVAVTVNAVNDPPVITTADTLSIPENIDTNPTGPLLVTTVSATDADLPAQNLTFSIPPGNASLPGSADNDDFFIDSATGELTIDTCNDGCLPDFEDPSDADQNNVYQVIVAVSDGIVTTTKAISVTITNVNEPLAFSQPTTLPQAGSFDYSVSVAANDPDGGPISVTAVTLPAWMSFTSTGNGTGTLTGFPNPCAVNANSVSLRATSQSDTVLLNLPQTYSQTCIVGPPPA